MRGKRILNIQVHTPAAPILSNIDRRNEAIAHRYYYYHTFICYRYEKCLDELSKEFFLSEETIIDILIKLNATLNTLRATETTIKQLSVKYPHLNWKQQIEAQMKLFVA